MYVSKIRTPLLHRPLYTTAETSRLTRHGGTKHATYVLNNPNKNKYHVLITYCIH